MSAAPTGIGRALLVASAVTYFDSGKPVRRVSYANAADLYQYAGADMRGGVMAIESLAVPEGEWAEFLEAVYCSERFFHEYRIETYFAKIRPDKIGALLKVRQSGTLDWCDKLFRRFVERDGDGAGEVVLLRKHYDLRTSRVLYLEPKADAIEAADPLDGGVWRSVARSMRAALGQGNSVAQPTLLNGAVLHHGIDNPGGVDETAFGLQPLVPQPHSKDDDVLVPRTVFALIELQSTARIAAHLALLASEHPFVRVPLRRYVDQLQSDGVLSASYHRTFVTDRVEGDLLAVRIRERISELAATMKDNSVVKGAENGKSEQIDVSSGRELYTYDELTEFLEHVTAQMAAATQQAGLLESHARSLADILRDAVNIETAQANLTLQQSIKRLTYGGIVIAVVALLSAFLPDAVKQAMFASLVSLLPK